jgi:hypothetical protein
MAKSNRKSTILIAVVFLLLFGAAGVLMFKTGQTKTAKKVAQNPEQNTDQQKNARYYNDEYQFGFVVPNGFKVLDPVPEADGKSFLVIGPSQASVQINVRYLDQDSGDISAEAILESNPTLKISDISEGTIDGTKTLTFKSADGAVLSYELWSIRNDVLYQVSALTRSKDIFEQVVSSFSFKKL